MSSNKYEDNVIFRARELAHVGYPKGYKLSEWGKIMDMARLSVQREARAYKDAWTACDARDADFDNYTLGELLVNSGLIPPPNETK